MQNQEIEKEIDLIHLLVQIAYKWRSILACALVFAALLGTVKAIIGVDEKDVAKYELSLSEFNEKTASYEQLLDSSLKLVEEYQTYCNESVYYNLLDCPVYSAASSYVLDYEYEGFESEQAFVNSTLQAFVPMVNCADTWEDLKSVVDIDAKYLRELVSISVDTGTSTLYVRAYYSDADTARQLCDAAAARLSDATVDGKALKCVSSATTRETNSSIQDHVTNINAKLKSAMTTYSDNIKQYSALDKEPTPPGRGIGKFTVLGFIAGAAMLVFVYAAIYIFSGKINTSDEVKSYFDIAVLGEFGVEKKRGIDAIIQKFEKVNFEPKESTYARIAANVDTLVSGGENVLITGQVGAEKLEEVKAELAERMTKKVNLEVSENITSSVDTIRKLENCDAVILVEKCGVSRFETLNAEAEYAKRLGKKIIGCVIA